MECLGEDSLAVDEQEPDLVGDWVIGNWVVEDWVGPGLVACTDRCVESRLPRWARSRPTDESRTPERVGATPHLLHSSTERDPSFGPRARLDYWEASRGSWRAAGLAGGGRNVIRHIAVFRWNAGVPASEVEEVEQALRKLRSELTGLRDYRFGTDIGLVEGNWDFAVVADLHDEAAFQRYASNAEHRRIISELIAPIRAERASVQLSLSD